MRLNIIGDIYGLEDGLSLLSQELGFEIDSRGIPVIAHRRTGNIRICKEEEEIHLGFERDIHFFRGLGLLVETLSNEKDLDITETPQFHTLGVMFDVSRNAVMKPQTIKDMLKKMAIMGLDTMMLYAEDTYEIPGKPYFGYMRGRYTYDELKECDDYAAKLGIEMIPCIQTLGHLAQALKWEVMKELRDTDDILLAENEETYEFIEEMLKAASAPFRSKRIHIGMDEAHMLGLGNYLQKKGYKPRFEIMLEHLNRVNEIAKKLELKPMMWSDMFFRLGSPTGGYYDLNSTIPQDVAEKIPEGVELIYWDYYHSGEDFYKEWIRRHRSLGSEPIFAGGLWTWTSFCTRYGRAFKYTDAALSACKSEGLKEAFVTLWYDDGGENNYYTALPGLHLFAEHGYHNQVDHSKLRERFEFCNGISYEAFKDLESLDMILGEDDGGIANPAKYLLWQDPLVGLFDIYVQKKPVSSHYMMFEKKFQEYSLNNPKWSFIFDFAAKLSRALSLKADIGVRIIDAYKRGDRDALKSISEDDLPELLKRINATRVAHRQQWFKTNKPFGWEVIDIRYGGVCARVESTTWRLTEYIEGRIDSIPELEEERLPFYDEKPKGSVLIFQKRYRRIVTAGLF